MASMTHAHLPKKPLLAAIRWLELLRPLLADFGFLI